MEGPEKYKIYVIESGLQKETEAVDIPITFENQEIGALCLLSNITTERAAITDYQASIYRLESFLFGEIHSEYFTFKKDYVVIRYDWINTYEEHKQTSAFWGEYRHQDATDAAAPLKNIKTSISIEKNLNYRTKRHQEALSKYSVNTNLADKYLSLYHCLEIDFDHEVVKRIKNLNEDDLSQLGVFVKNLKLDDIERLQILIASIPTTILESHIYELRKHKASAVSIFYTFGKESNPMKEEYDFEQYIVNSPAISKEEFERIKRDKNKTTTIDPTKDYQKFLVRICCYWVYRIRCCIAHNKLGEYHISSQEDLAFLRDFGEPLLKEVIRYRLSDQATN